MTHFILQYKHTQQWWYVINVCQTSFEESSIQFCNNAASSLFSHFSQESYIWNQGISWRYLRWEQSGFLPSPSCSFQHALLSVSITLYFVKMVTFLVWSRVCCAVLCCAVLCCAVLCCAKQTFYPIWFCCTLQNTRF